MYICVDRSSAKTKNSELAFVAACELQDEKETEFETFDKYIMIMCICVYDLCIYVCAYAILQVVYIGKHILYGTIL